ncbi:MAG: DUF6067 family protein [Planctomycetaceae bacterium]|nr:DUF6067 family protein [Planctomycetaceae bacterium]
MFRAFKTSAIHFMTVLFFAVIVAGGLPLLRADEPPPDLSSFDHHGLIVFPEVRENPIRWYELTEEQIKQVVRNENVFTLHARPGEFFVYQIGVVAPGHSAMDDVRLEFSDMQSAAGRMIPSAKNTCFNLSGIDCYGNPFVKAVHIEPNHTQAMWIGIDLENVIPDTYTGSVTVRSGDKKQTVHLSLVVAGEPVTNHGYDDGKRLARLNWLNSTIGFDDEVTADHIPIAVEGNTVSILGRKLVIDPTTGLPALISTSFEPSNQFLLETDESIVAKPFRFVIEKENGDLVSLHSGKLEIVEKSPSKVTWTVTSASSECELQCTGRMEFDGYVDYRLELRPLETLKVRDIRLEVPMVAEKAEYAMGLNLEGGLRPGEYQWKWTEEKNQDMLWLGVPNGGLRIKWKAENYVRPLINIYYQFGKLKMPPSWQNGGKGGVDFAQKDETVFVNAYSGERELTPGGVLHFDFELMITPLKLLDRKNKFGDRYYHGGGGSAIAKVGKAGEVGANILNIHHAEDVYPFINYPHLDENTEELRQLADLAHEENIRLKLYFTTRELTKNLPEFWAFYSLNGEVLFPGPGNESRTEALHPNGPHPWLIENVREKYIPAWSNAIGSGKFRGELDLSVITTPDSRLNNFYAASLDWMVRNLGIDGVYIDDSALNRETIRRARKILDANRPNGRIDIHSFNHFNSWCGYASCLNLYMELLSYADLVWIGEARDYNRKPDHWLVEVSGIPYGLPGQMLEHGGHPWRGMVYGITNRAGWTANPPHHLWKFFDEYQMADRTMIGYWDKNSPMTSENDSLRMTLYQGNEDIVCAIGNWSHAEESAKLKIDWVKLGFDPQKTEAFQPGIQDFQDAQETISLSDLTVPAGQGLIIILKKIGGVP